MISGSILWTQHELYPSREAKIAVSRTGVRSERFISGALAIRTNITAINGPAVKRAALLSSGSPKSYMSLLPYVPLHFYFSGRVTATRLRAIPVPVPTPLGKLKLQCTRGLNARLSQVQNPTPGVWLKLQCIYPPSTGLLQMRHPRILIGQVPSLIGSSGQPVFKPSDQLVFKPSDETKIAVKFAVLAPKSLSLTQDQTDV